MGDLAGSSRFVDYGRVADRYRHGRDLSLTVLERWREAVLPHLAHLPCRLERPLRVVDVGAGTGLFAAAWPRWMPATVIAVEPNAAMIAAGHAGVRFVQAAAERLPLADSCVDVAWISTSLHHFTDLDRAIAECARVLDDQGRALVRTFLPGYTELTWLVPFPGQEKALARFPDLDQLADLFGRYGLVVDHTCDVYEFTSTYAEAADWVELMRHADSMLTALTDEEVDQGVRRLRAEAGRATRSVLSLVVLRRAKPPHPAGAGTPPPTAAPDRVA